MATESVTQLDDDLAAVEDFPRRLAAVNAELQDMRATTDRLVKSGRLPYLEALAYFEPAELEDITELIRVHTLVGPDLTAFQWWHERCFLRSSMAALRDQPTAEELDAVGYPGPRPDVEALEEFNRRFEEAEPDLALWLNIWCAAEGDARMTRTPANLERLAEIELAIARLVGEAG